MRRGLPFVIVIVVGLATIVSGIVLYRAKKPTQLSKAGETGAVHVLGPSNAPVTLEEYGDFQCPPCGKLSEPINQLQHDYNPRLRVVFHHFPLVNHQHARAAAWAAEAAGLQGKFWEMHDMIYHEQDVWSKSPDAPTLFQAYAGYIGLNVERFKKDMESPEVKERVEADQKQGASLGIKNTPTIFINNREIDPKQLNPTGLRATIDSALKNANASS